MDFNTFLTVFLSVLAAGSVIFFAFSLSFYLQKRYIQNVIRSFIESPDDETPSKFAETIDAVGRVIASRMVQQIKTTVMGMNSVDSKNASREAIEGIKEASPSLAGLASLLPKKWVKNPEIMGVLAGVLGKIGKPGNGSVPPGVEQTTFKL